MHPKYDKRADKCVRPYVLDRHRSGDNTARWGKVNYGMIATGNHCYLGFAARSTTPTLQGWFFPAELKNTRICVSCVSFHPLPVQ